jgi:hypothetical protein
VYQRRRAASGGHSGVKYDDVDLVEHLVRAEHFCQPHDVDHHLAHRNADGVAVAEVVRSSADIRRSCLGVEKMETRLGSARKRGAVTPSTV